MGMVRQLVNYGNYESLERTLYSYVLVQKNGSQDTARTSSPLLVSRIQ